MRNLARFMLAASSFVFVGPLLAFLFVVAVSEAGFVLLLSAVSLVGGRLLLLLSVGVSSMDCCRRQDSDEVRLLPGFKLLKKLLVVDVVVAVVVVVALIALSFTLPDFAVVGGLLAADADFFVTPVDSFVFFGFVSFLAAVSACSLSSFSASFACLPSFVLISASINK